MSFVVSRGTCRFDEEPAARRQSGARGFTLVEVIVVLAVLAVLLGLSVAAIRKAREASAAAVCRSNLRAIGVAFISYAMNESNQSLPYVKIGSPQWEDMLTIHGLKRDQHCRCPNDQEVFPNGGSSYDWRDAGGPDKDSGGSLLTTFTQHPTTFSGRNYATIRPDLIMAFEALTGWHRPGYVNAVTADAMVMEVEETRFYGNLNCPVAP